MPTPCWCASPCPLVPSPNCPPTSRSSSAWLWISTPRSAEDGNERAHPYPVPGALPTPSTPALLGRFDRALPECQELTMSDRPLKVCVVGTGHIGLPLAAVLAEAGFEVVGYDTNDDFISRVNTTGVAGFREEGLDELLARHLHSRLTLTSTPPVGQDVYIITVG